MSFQANYFTVKSPRNAVRQATFGTVQLDQFTVFIRSEHTGQARDVAAAILAVCDDLDQLPPPPDGEPSRVVWEPAVVTP